MKFDESNIFSETPNLIKRLIGKDLICAKDYLNIKIPINFYNCTIYTLGQYTLEAIIIHVLGLLFNSIQESSVVRVSTLVDRLDRTVRAQANIILKKQLDSSTSTSSRVDSSNEGDINHKKGNKLLEFMLERKVIYIENITQDDKAVVKEKGKGDYKSTLFAFCNFELSLLLNLPMVCKPLDWKLPSDWERPFDLDIEKPYVLSDMRGGYLSLPTLDIYYIIGLVFYHPITQAISI